MAACVCRAAAFKQPTSSHIPSVWVWVNQDWKAIDLASGAGSPDSTPKYLATACVMSWASHVGSCWRTLYRRDPPGHGSWH